MKEIKTILFAIVCTLLASCMGDEYAAPEMDVIPFGNNAITESNVVTIAQLKEKFKFPMITDFRSGNSYKEVTEDMQIKGYVTGNDITGNLYNEIALQDETGAITVGIQQGGLFGFLPVGAEIIIDLKGLYVGNYRLQPKIGAPTKVKQGANAGKDQLGGITRTQWAQHFKLTGASKIIEPEVFAEGQASTQWKTLEDAGKLGILKGVTIKNGSYYDGTNTTNIPFNEESMFANPDFNNSVSWFFNEQPTTVMLYNSNFADFAANLLPHETVDITGIIKRYNSSWEIIIRDLNDIQPAQVFSYDDLEGSGHGTQDDPFNVKRAIALCTDSHNDPGVEIFITGVITSVTEASTQYGNTTYFITDPEAMSPQGPAYDLQVFRGKYINGESITENNAAEMMQSVGKTVLIKGKLKLYNGTPEVDAGSQIISMK